MSSVAVSSSVVVAIPLSELAVGERARVEAMLVPGGNGERLMEMGLTPGTALRLVRRGLGGDPIQVELRGYMLTLRKVQARDVRVSRSS